LGLVLNEADDGVGEFETAEHDGWRC